MRACVFVLGTTLAACNALTGLSDDYRLAPEIAEGDGGTGVGGDGGTSPVAPDGAPLPEGGEAGPGGRFCATVSDPNAFCADFEDPSLAAPAFGWDPAGFERNGGDVAVETGVGKDGSRGLRARATADGGASLKVALWKTLPGAVSSAMSHLELRFDFRIASSTMDYAALGAFAFPQQGGGLPVFGLGWFGDYLDTTSPPGAGDANRYSGGVGAWHAAKLTLDRAANGTYDLELFVDGTVVDRKSGLSIGTPTAVQVRFGAYFTSTSPGAVDVAFDDVVATRK